MKKIFLSSEQTLQCDESSIIALSKRLLEQEAR
jgi:hypothetical protein